MGGLPALGRFLLRSAQGPSGRRGLEGKGATWAPGEAPLVRSRIDVLASTMWGCGSTHCVNPHGLMRERGFVNGGELHGETLSVQARGLYGRIARREIARREQVAPGDGQALEDLKVWLLVTEDPTVPGMLVVLDPQEAGRRRLDREMQTLARAADRAGGIPAVADELSVAFARSQRMSDGQASEFLTDPALVNARIADALQHATSELLTAQPGGPRTAEQVRIAEARDGAALTRGVSIRSLYRGTVLEDPVTAGYVSLMSGRGAQFRTMTGPFERCVIIDRKMAFITDHVSPDSPPHVAWLVRDRAAVAFIATVYEDMWRRSEIWHGDQRLDAGPVGQRTTQLQREILRDAAVGRDQNQIASRLGVSERTVNGELCKLKRVWGVTSLPELTYQWALSPDRLVNDGPGDVEDAA